MIGTQVVVLARSGEEVIVGQPGASSAPELVIDLEADPPRLDFDGRTLLLERRPLGRAEKLARRSVDLLVGLTLLVVLTPLIAVAALAIALSSRGPVFYASPRMGWRGSTISVWKLRSMYADADERLAELLAGEPALRHEYDTTRKLRDDPRITPVGRWLRRASIDELPQLWNVVKGEMSIVGPRPKLLDEPPLYGATFATVVGVKPGLTGLWQVSGRSDLSFDERIFLDVSYVMERSFRGDLTICLRTFRQLWRPGRHGAA